MVYVNKDKGQNSKYDKLWCVLLRAEYNQTQAFFIDNWLSLI